jgi:hypothetical protein
MKLIPGYRLEEAEQMIAAYQEEVASKEYQDHGSS